MRLKVLERFLGFQFSGMYAQGLGISCRIVSSSIIVPGSNIRVFKYPGLLLRLSWVSFQDPRMREDLLCRISLQRIISPGSIILQDQFSGYYSGFNNPDKKLQIISPGSIILIGYYRITSLGTIILQTLNDQKNPGLLIQKRNYRSFLWVQLHW